MEQGTAMRYFYKTPFHRTSSRAVALITVLAVLVLITGLVVAFFTAVTADVSSSTLYANDVRSKQLADSAVNLVIGQIVEATKGFEAHANGHPDLSKPLAWASQPGAIRTFKENGVADRVFKLYSARRVVATPSEFAAELSATNANSDLPGNWSSRPALFSDLNAPVKDENGNDVYPIIDPSALSEIEGFELSGAATSGTSNPVPMPTQWLYLLKDGRITSPDPASSTGNTANWGASSGEPVPSATNPIVGRIAFWTDDESCKLNINTAAEGTYWDSPTTTRNTSDIIMALNQPAQREYQRYPGHPASVSLAPVFWQKFGLPTPTSTLDPLITPRDPDQDSFAALPLYAASYYQKIYDLVPRVVSGGSNSGTRSTATNIGIASASVDRDRLYSSVDELIMDKNRSAQLGLDQSFIKKSRFFLTATSRAPEVNLFGKPRVTIWPIHLNVNKRSPLDKLIAHCSTIGSGSSAKPFYFTRANPASTVADFTARNSAIYDYLRILMGRTIPGSMPNGSIAAKFSPANADQILTEVYDYIRSCVNLLDSSGPTTNIATRYQYAYTPSPTNNMTLVKGSGQVVPFQHPANGTKGFGRFPTIKSAGLVFIALNANQPPEMTPGSGTINPMHPFLPTTAAAINLSNQYPVFAGASGASRRTHASLATAWQSGVEYPNELYSGPALSPFETQMQAYFVLDLVQPAVGYVGRREDFRIRIRNLDAFRAGANSLGMPANTTMIWDGSNGSQGREQGYTMGVGDMVGNKQLGTGSSQFPFYGTAVVVSGETFVFTGGEVQIEMLAADNTVVQTLILEMPSGTFPTPLLSPAPPSSNDPTRLGFVNTTRSGDPYPPTSENELAFRAPGIPNTLAERFSRATGNGGPKTLFFTAGINAPMNPRNWKETADTIRSVEVLHGDPRVIGAMKTVPKTLFAPHVHYNSNIRAAHSFTTGAGYAWRGATLQKLTTAPGSYESNKPDGNPLIGGASPNDQFPGISAPDVGSQVNFGNPAFVAKWNAGGDYDSGIPGISDGPYINKADEGNNSSPVPYWTGWGANEAIGATLFSPNRQVASAVLFGSLPTGVNPSTTDANVRPWQTLLFCPHPNATANGGSHFSLATAGPRDHQLLDFFTMPVVEPYAISEPFSTAGKVNMNYRIVPFSHIKRDTAMRGVLRSARVLAIPDSWIEWYRGVYGSYPGKPGSWASNTLKNEASASGFNYFRYPIHATETLKAFEERFDAGEVFRSAGEICDVFLYPARQPTAANTDAAAIPLVTRATSGSDRDAALKAWWYSGPQAKSLTGDNLRERPYNFLYPKLTTKSNAYTVHFRVQTLKQLRSATPGTWVEGRDQILSEYRGSSLIERYIDPSDSRLPDFATEVDPARTNIDKYYRFRVVQARQFAP